MTTLFHAAGAGHLLVADAVAGNEVSDGDLLTVPGILPALRQRLRQAATGTDDRAAAEAMVRRLQRHFAPAVGLIHQLEVAEPAAESPLLDARLNAVQAVSRHQARHTR
jgi:hypothetical protein